MIENEKEGGFYWCAINGKAESYCMANLCANCPANKDGFFYNPNSELVKAYKKGKIESRFDRIENNLKGLESRIAK